MPALAFVSPTPMPRAFPSARTAHRTAHKRRLPRAPSASLSTDLAAAAAVATTVSLSLLPLQPYPPSSALPAAGPSERATPAVPVAQLVVSADVGSAADAHAPLAVVGVAKAAIHDYDVAASTAAAAAIAPSPHAAPAPAPQPPSEPDGADEARRELALSARLITAVLTGAVVGVERRATHLNLGVRSVTLVSLTGALAAVSVASSASASASASAAAAALSAALGAPSLLGALAVAATGLTAALGLLVATRLRARRTRNARAMCAVVGMTASMGVACGLGLGLLTAALYLCAVATMRGNAGRVLRDHHRADARDGQLFVPSGRAVALADAGGRAVSESDDDQGFDLSMRTAAAAAAAVQSDAL